MVTRDSEGKRELDAGAMRAVYLRDKGLSDRSSVEHMYACQRSAEDREMSGE